GDDVNDGTSLSNGDELVEPYDDRGTFDSDLEHFKVGKFRETMNPHLFQSALKLTLRARHILQELGFLGQPQWSDLCEPTGLVRVAVEEYRPLLEGLVVLQNLPRQRGRSEERRVGKTGVAGV